MKKLKYLLPIIAIVAVFFMAGYTYSWFVTGADAQLNVIQVRSDAAVSLAFTIDGENQTAPLDGEDVTKFNGQKGVDTSSHFIAAGALNDDRVYIASYPLAFNISDLDNLGVPNANVRISFDSISVVKMSGEEVVLYELMNSETDVKPEDRFTWEIVWNDDVLGPYGTVDSSDFYIESGAPTETIELPYRTLVNCTFNIVYIGQETYWAENYRTAPTETVYDACHYSADSYKGCRFEFIVKLEVVEAE